MAPAAPDTSRAARVLRVVQLCTCCLRSMSRDPPHCSLLGRLPRSTVTPPPSQGSFMDIALTCYPAADYRVRQGGRCLRRIHSTGPHVITCPVTKPRIVSVTDVSATTHVARSIRITLRYGGLLCYGAGSP